jgi:NitT/TauT family transport system substrate-binding protein
MAGASEGAENPFKPEKNQIKIAVPGNAYDLIPWYVAVDSGLYEKEGLKVELLTLGGGAEVMKLVIGKSIDVGLSGLSSASIGINAGQKIKLFYGGVNSPGWDWYAVPKIKSLSEAKGASLGITRYGSSTDNLTRYALKSVGLDPKKDVKILQVGDSAGRLIAMEKGMLDVSIYQPPYNFFAAEKGYNLVLSLKNIIKEYPGQCHFATEDFIKNNPNTIKTLLRAYVQAVRLVKKDRALSVKSLMKHLLIEEKYAGLAYDYVISDIHEDGRLPDGKSMDIFWDISIMVGEVKEKWPREKYFDSTFIDTYSNWKP